MGQEITSCGTTLIALARILAALYRERPPESSSGCSELAAIKARRRASTFPLLSKGCCLMLGSSLQKPILQIFYHKLRQCQPLSRNFTKNSIFLQYISLNSLNFLNQIIHIIKPIFLSN